ncbi:hypothetical protein P7L75_00900 (plasmid) [Tistrella mobilis]|uniref:hypothetical protein n=1 Tax=Tistrella mobilis TaxID=171437 RepID=UPI00355880BB
MTVSHLTVTFSNTTVLNGVRDSDSFLYLNTENSGRIAFKPNRKATFTPANLVPWSGDENFNPSGTVIYLFGLDSLMPSPLDWWRIGVDGHWIVGQQQDQEHGRYLALTPAYPQEIPANGSLPLSITGLRLSGDSDQSTKTLTFRYYNIKGITGDGPLNHQNAHVVVGLRQPPDVGPLPTLTDRLGYRCRLSTADAFRPDPDVAWIKTTWPEEAAVQNEFTVDIGPAADKTPASAGADTSLILSFATADTEFGALASRADLANVRVIADEGAEGWTIVPHTDEQTPYWKIIIPAGRPVRGRLRFTELVTYLDAGWSDLLVQYRNVPGYRDGQFYGKLYKYGPPHPVNVDFTIVKSRKNPDDFYFRYVWDGFETKELHLFISIATDSIWLGDAPMKCPDAGVLNNWMFKLSQGGDYVEMYAVVEHYNELFMKTRLVGTVPISVIHV